MATKEKLIVKSIRIVIGVSILVVILLLGYSYILGLKLNSDIKTQLEETSIRNSEYVNSVINSKINSLIEISGRLSMEKDYTLDQKVESLKEAKERHGFKRLGIASLDGHVKTVEDDGFCIFNLGDRNYFKEAVTGKTCVTAFYKDFVDKEPIIIFGIPIWKDGVINGDEESILYATISIREFEKLLDIDFFSSAGYFYIIDSDGNIILSSINDDDKLNKNVFELLFNTDSRNKTVIEEIKNNFGTNEKKYFSFYNKGERYMYFTPLNTNDWYMLNIVKSSVVEKNKAYIMRLTYLICGILFVIFALLLVTILRSEKNKNDRLEEVAYVDPLTNGYTYQKFLLEGREILNKTDNDKNMAFLFMDIDGFKFVNEIYGYDIGDEILRHIWNVCYNDHNPDTEVFARKNADKFVYLFQYKDLDSLMKRIDNIILKIQNCYLKTAKSYLLKPKFGIYPINNKNESLDSMCNYAIIACSKVKGKNDESIEFYADEFGKERIQNKLIEDEMEYAYANKNFVVYYQPKYGSKDKKITGAEALIRWKKDGTIVPPYKFIPVAEENGFITKLDEYVFEEVCWEQKKLLEMGIEPVPVSVNVSQKHLYFENFVERYSGILETVGIDGKYVQIELTESAMFENKNAIMDIIIKLKNKNFKILMDDFGTGYSSLMMLKSVPIDVMKLDKSFVDDYNEEKGEMIIRCVVQLAKEMNISITAEGVETQEQYEFLRELECDDIQGYYFAKPMPEEDYEKLLMEEKGNKE